MFAIGGNLVYECLETSVKKKKKKTGRGWGKKALHLCNCSQNTCKMTALIYDGERKRNAVRQTLTKQSGEKYNVCIETQHVLHTGAERKTALASL